MRLSRPLAIPPRPPVHTAASRAVLLWGTGFRLDVGTVHEPAGQAEHENLVGAPPHGTTVATSRPCRGVSWPSHKARLSQVTPGFPKTETSCSGTEIETSLALKECAVIVGEGHLQRGLACDRDTESAAELLLPVPTAPRVRCLKHLASELSFCSQGGPAGQVSPCPVLR